MNTEEKIIKILTQNKKTLSLGESCTGGLVAHRLSNIPGASKCLVSSIVAYSNEAKVKFLKVSEKTIQKYGAVSEDTAIAMAQGAQKNLKSDFGIGITGIAGPTGGTKSKPVGLTYIAVATKFETLCLKCQFEGTRTNIKTKTATQALKLLLEFLE